MTAAKVTETDTGTEGQGKRDSDCCSEKGTETERLGQDGNRGRDKQVLGHTDRKEEGQEQRNKDRVTQKGTGTGVEGNKGTKTDIGKGTEEQGQRNRNG